MTYHQGLKTWMEKDNSGRYFHFYLQILQSKPTRKCVPSRLEKAKVIPPPTNGKAPFIVSNSRPIILLPTLSKIWEQNVFDQIQC
jgi:hypothetical protein